MKQIMIVTALFIAGSAGRGEGEDCPKSCRWLAAAVFFTSTATPPPTERS